MSIVRAYPTPEELEEWSARARRAHEDIQRVVRGIVRLFNPDGPQFITGSYAMRLQLTAEAERTYQEMRRDLYPKDFEVEFRKDASRAFLALEQAGIDLSDWEYMGIVQNAHRREYYEFAHVRRRYLAYEGPRSIQVLRPNGTHNAS